ncbi:MAG: thrombospondin type 3 repeat-containing protein [Acidobacteriota bacterium]
MDFSNWKTWLLIGAALLGLFAIYVFAAPQSMLHESGLHQERAEQRPIQAVGQKVAAKVALAEAGVEPVRLDLLDPSSGSYSSDRNLFRFVEPPPPPPTPIATPKPPPDSDRDGIPDVQDNCPKMANPDQTDIDRNGIGDLCQTTPVIQPTPPPPTPPAFPYTYIGSFGTPTHPIAAFSAGDKIDNVRVGQTFGRQFILRSIGIESVDIGYVGFPADVRTRVAVGARQ